MLRPLAALSIAILAVPALATPDTATVKHLVTLPHEAGAQLRIELDAPPIFSTHGQTSPPKLIIELADAHAEPQVLTAPNTLVSSVKVSPLKTPAGEATRIEVAFPRAVTYDVHVEKKTLVVTLNDPRKVTSLSSSTRAMKVGPKVAALTPPSNATSRADFGGSHRGIRLAQDEGAVGAGTDDEEDVVDDSVEDTVDEGDDGAAGGASMTYVGFRNRSDVSEVFVRMNKRNAKYKVRREGDNLLVLEIEDASIPLRNNRNHLDATFFDSPVKMITPTEVSSSTPKIRVVIEMKSDAPYKDARDGVDIVLSFRK